MKEVLIGLGGASGNILNNIAEVSPNDYKYLYINTDKKSIEDSIIENKLWGLETILYSFFVISEL